MPVIFSLLFFTAGFVVFFIIQAYANSLPMSGSVESVGKIVSLKKTSFIVLIVCSLTASILSWKAISKKKSVLFYVLFTVELLTAISLIVFFLWAQTLFWM